MSKDFLTVAACLGDKVRSLEEDLYSPSELLLLRRAQEYRRKLDQLEDRILFHASPDWFRCEKCQQIYHETEFSEIGDLEICESCAEAPEASKNEGEN